jgi:hypothetical protein
MVLQAPSTQLLTHEVRERIQDLWRANPTWGSPRIVGELAFPEKWSNYAIGCILSPFLQEGLLRHDPFS